MADGPSQATLHLHANHFGKHGNYKTLAQKQASCLRCLKVPSGIGCKNHLSNLQVQNIEMGKTFGKKADGLDCKVCANHGYYCCNHMYQNPTPTPGMSQQEK